MITETANSDSMLDAFDKQIAWCRQLESPFTATVLEILKGNLQSGGAWVRLVADWPSDPVSDAVPLRCAGALHALVLTKAAPALAALYPPRKSLPPAISEAALAEEIARAGESHGAFIAQFLKSPPQTNEVGRSAVLLGGFLEIARVAPLPLSTLEIGASAGLNLSWDRYRYELGAASWGDAGSAVRLAPEWRGPAPPLDAPVSVIARTGCDVSPIDLSVEENQARLKAYVWADQRERLLRLEGAIAMALASGVRVDKADALVWLETKLKDRHANTVTVIYHSIMWQYMPQQTRDDIRRLIEDKGRVSKADSPLGWLRFEPGGSQKNLLTLSLWPNYGTKTLATAHPHGTNVEWMTF
jgi:hypothetical protein